MPRIEGGAILLHDNVHSYIANVMKDKLGQFQWEIMDHPPYSPDLFPCNFYIFSKIKMHLKGIKKTLDAAV